MKSLIVGIDGGTQRIFEAFEMPYVHNLLRDGTSRQMDEDLFSRGWAEIVNGKTAEHTRAFYMGPQMDGTHSFSISYKTKESEDYGAVPIWRLAEESGCKVGIMNVPTTSPAQAVNGFMVGSGGGGLNKVEGLPSSLVYPAEVKTFLEANDYIVDIRLTTSGIADIKELFEKLILKEKRRAEIYVELCQKHDIDFGLIVDRATTIVQYLCMSEIETYIAMQSMPELAVQNQRKDPEEDHLIRLLKDFYRALDDNIRHLCESLSPEYFLLTADHSTVPYKYKGNMNAFLEEVGFLRRPSAASTSFIQPIRRWARKVLPSRYSAQLKKKMPQGVLGLVEQVDWSRTLAFGNDYIDGIYINDTRFGGPVRESQVYELSAEIIEKFNSHPVACEYGISLKQYRSNFAGSRFQDHLPDLILDKPDELHVVGRGDFIYHNSNYGPVPAIDTITDDMFSGQKGRDPIFLMNDKLAGLVDPEDPYNLTLAHILTGRIFK